MFAFQLLLAVATAASPDIVQRQSRMTDLYEQACLKAFPDEHLIEVLMTERKAVPLTAEEVKVTLGEDPGRGWQIKDGNISALLILEYPPYNACSLRWPMPGYPDIQAYRAIADRYEVKKGGFGPMKPYDTDIAGIHVHAVGEQRNLAGGGTESLFVFDQHITDPQRRAAGETGIMFRFVHQFAPQEKP